MFLSQIVDQPPAASVWALKWVMQWYMDEEFSWSECSPSQFNHKQMHACMPVHLCVSLYSLYCYFCKYLLIQYWTADVFAGVRNMCLGLHFVFRDKVNQRIQSQLSLICAADWQHDICADILWLLFWAIVLFLFCFFIYRSQAWCCWQTIQNNHFFPNIDQAIDQLYFFLPKIPQ